jgi:excisionase family DNA binding protein/PAS domain S-box-containing protein
VDSQWLSVREVARLLQVNDETVRRWIRRKDLAVLETWDSRAGYRISRDDLDHFIWQRYGVRNQVEQIHRRQDDFDHADEQQSTRFTTVVPGAGSNDSAPGDNLDGLHGRNHADSLQYLSLIRRIPGITYLADQPGDEDGFLNRRIAFVSPEFEDILGMSAADMRADSHRWWECVVDDDLTGVVEAYRATNAGASRFSIEYRILDRNREVCWVLDEAIISKDQKSNDLLWHGIVTNISERKRIEEALHSHSTRLSAIAELGQRALGGLDLSDLMDVAVRFVQQALDVDVTEILEREPGGESLVMRAGMGWKRGEADPVPVGVDAESHAGYALLSNEPVVVEDLVRETRFNDSSLLRDYGVRSGISVIIAGAGMPWGVLGAHATTLRTFTRDDVIFLQSVANIIALAIRTNASENENGNWLSVRNVAETLKVNDETVRRWVRRGELPVFDPGSSRAGYRIHPSDLDTFIGERYKREQKQ